MMNLTTKIPHPFDETHEALLADVAIRIQLPKYRYNIAVERFETIKAYLERISGPIRASLEDHYPQGSMATNTTISRNDDEDEFDVDLVVQIPANLAQNPKTVLDLLFEALNGPQGSQYHGKVERQTRCVTVHYSDKMHIDVIPAVRDFKDQREKVSLLSHHKPEIPNQTGKIYPGNPWGFKEWFNSIAKPEGDYRKFYAEKARDHERILMETRGIKAENLPDQEDINEKSRKKIALQLLKRFKDIRYAGRQGLKPVPSVLLSAWVGQAPQVPGGVFETLISCATFMANQIGTAQAQRTLVSLVNPSYERDVLTDRWPENLTTQEIFLDDLIFLLEKLRDYKEAVLDQKKIILSDLFGEVVSERVFKDFTDRLGGAIKTGKTLHRPDGRVALASSGVTAKGATPLVGLSKPAPNKFYGGQDANFPKGAK